MITVIAKYRVKKESAEEAKKLIRKFVTRVKDKEPETIVYESFQLKNDVCEFLNYMKFANAAAREFHQNTDYVKKFAKKLYPLCEKNPEFIQLEGFY